VVDGVLDERAAGVPDELDAEGAGEDGGSADEGAARRLLAKKAGSLSRVADPRERRQRAYALLARNGFDAGVCRDVGAGFVREGQAREADFEPGDD
jgi:hypothetical protein